MNDNSETSQTAAEQNSDGRTSESSEANWLDILPRNDVAKKVRRHLACGKTKHAAHDQADKCGNCHRDECLANSHKA